MSPGWAVVTAVLVLAATATARAIGRWFKRAITSSFREVVADSMSDRFTQLESKLDAVQEQNRADHGAVAERMAAVEASLDRAETELADVNARLAAVEAAVNLQGGPR